ncbi:hypothetical protein RclHR1_06250011 [Rhizophagus clarus]|uniref:Oxoglutarate iron-dependent oxygenase n=1 Tax=Rhizophagus clarus TaxID=94130 RepID=A0A2Z6SIB7_9GLOM|nr:hypothetical protein RclHR1_06250011 [Rhizophagus clarus]GES97379.1 oxoglutarate iron-dependent oxygenase [Rhizophagus clarus]
MEPSTSSNIYYVKEYNVYVKEKIEISDLPLPVDNDVTIRSDVNINRPKVWAQTRQEVCETLAYFRSYQSRVYHKDNVAYAYLLDAFGAKRDFCNGRVIISHEDGKNDKCEHSKSQSSTDNSIKSLLNNYVHNQPLAIIIGNKCSISNFKVPARYCVLGMYLITHAWAEHEDLKDGEDSTDLTDEEALIDNTPFKTKTKTNKRKTKSDPFICWKFRFEWINTQEFLPWWEYPAETTTTDMMDLDYSDSTNHSPLSQDSTCSNCKKRFFQIYESWMCLNFLCESFWKVWNPIKKEWEIASQDLHYNQKFLSPGFIPKKILSHPLPFSIIPPPIKIDGIGAHTLMHWRGFYCIRCGRVSCRVKWNCWECSNCRKTLLAPKTIVSKSMLIDPYRPVFTGPATDCEGSILDGSNITRERTILSNGAVLITYKFPEENQIFHYVSNEICNEMPDIFLRDFQEIDNEQLKRHPIKCQIETQLFARQFTLNVGEHYRFALELNTVPWTEAPRVCSDALSYIQNIIKIFLPDVSHDFNRMSVAMHIEGQKMSWHDDGEKGVGPIIASLSLGSPAEIKIRRKPKKDSVKSDDKNESMSEDKNGGVNEGVNEGKNEDMNEGMNKDINEDKSEEVEETSSSFKFEERKPKSKKRNNSDEIVDWVSLFPITRRRGPDLALTLNHGDLVIMTGETLQENYDYIVSPKGFRIACTIQKIEQ